MVGLGRYYFDGAGNIAGVTPATSTNAAFTSSFGRYTVNFDCSARITLNNGATYDAYVDFNGNEANLLQTNSSGAGNVAVLRRTAACVSLNYPNTFAFSLNGASRVTSSSGVASYTPTATIGSLSTNGSGQFTLTQSQYGSTGVQRTTAAGTYTVTADCSVALQFVNTPGLTSSNFVVPSGFRILMTDAANGLITVQSDANNVATGSLSIQ